MPAKDEIAAAAERLRRYRAGEPAHLIWSTLESDWKIADERMRQDTDTLADAYLAEHAAEPDRNEYPDSRRLSYGALAAILGSADNIAIDHGRAKTMIWECLGGSCVTVDFGEPITIDAVLRHSKEFPINTCGELRAFCVLAGWNNQERGASRGE